MYLLGYKNISRLIMVTIIVIIMLNTLLISLFYYKNQLNTHKESLIKLKYEKIKKQKVHLKKDILHIIDMIEYKYDYNKTIILEEKTTIRDWIKYHVKFDEAKSNYIFIYELLDKKGGDEFARLILNPNRPDIEGALISSKYKDIKGFPFREKFLDGINLYGETYVRYSYTKTDGTIADKISYFYYYEPLNWVVSKGVYIDDIQDDINLENITLEKRVNTQINQNLFFFLFFSIIAIIIAYIIGKRIQKIINEKDKKVKSTTKALANFNRKLDQKVKLEVEKNKENERLLMQKSKFVALGEMISLIAHQWRQPISELNAIIINVKLHYDLGKLTKVHIDKKTNEIEKLLEYMSNTIDDFRTFFKPDKQKEKFYFKDSLDRVIKISSAMLSEHKIDLKSNIDENLTINSYQNEFEQVVLNLISNAKDALVYDKIETPIIRIEAFEENNKTVVKIKDNAKGIKADILGKVFDPYFTTKEEANGTGIGLYMSKMIIEQNMKGKLKAYSSQNGSCFTITFIG